jgi:protein tyrosine phosphatase (PTP) superfamily phosphohydrolase (DUF442 family)
MSDPTHIRNWHRLGDRLTTSGQPTEDELEQIKALGVMHIINLALHSHEDALSDEAATVSDLDMNYVHIPVEFEHPTQAHYAQFCKAMADIGEEPVHVHCIVNARVSAFVYRYRRDVLGVKDDEARAAMEKIWRPGGVWAKFIGDLEAEHLPHRPPRRND